MLHLHYTNAVLNQIFSIKTYVIVLYNVHNQQKSIIYSNLLFATLAGILSKVNI